MGVAIPVGEGKNGTEEVESVDYRQKLSRPLESGLFCDALFSVVLLAFIKAIIGIWMPVLHGIIGSIWEGCRSRL